MVRTYELKWCLKGRLARVYQFCTKMVKNSEAMKQYFMAFQLVEVYDRGRLRLARKVLC